MGTNDYINPKLAVCWQQSDIAKIRRIVDFSKSKVYAGKLKKQERQSYYLFIEAGEYLLKYFEGRVRSCRRMPKRLRGHADSILDSL